MATGVVGILFLLLGLRVLRAAARHRALPDALVGVWFVCLGFGLPLVQAGSVAGGAPLEPLGAWLAAGQAATTLGMSALAVFVWRTFGVASAWRRALALALVALQWLSLALLAAADGFRPEAPAEIFGVALVRACVLAWAFGETFRYGRMLRRRLRLGLAEPVVVNRLALWSVWTGSASAVMLSVIALRVLEAQHHAGATVLDAPSIIATVVPFLSMGGFAIAVSMALAFFPPRAYLAWVERRAQGAAGSGAEAAV